MAQKPFLSVVIPAYNEAERIPGTLIDIDKRLSGKDFSYEILVVNDGSTDATADVVTRLATTVKNLKLVDNKINQGKGGVVKQGMLLAQGEYRLFMDADNATSIDQFERMLPKFKEGCSVVIGSRGIHGAKLDPPEPWFRQIPGKMGNLLIQALLLPGIKDTQCGFKAFTADAAEAVFPKLRVARWGFDVESLSLAKRLGFKIGEVPVHWINVAGSHIGLSAYLQVLEETFKIRWWLWTGAYGLRAVAEPASRAESKPDNSYIP